MAGRYRQKRKNRTGKLLWGITAAVIAVAIIIVGLALSSGGEPEPTQPAENSGISMEFEEMEPISLGQGLRISRVGAYTGIYMEDGSNNAVAGTMMVVLDNTGDKDLQLARFTLQYDDFIAEFEVTNIPAGTSVVALERNRRSAAGIPKAAQLNVVLFFRENMDLMENALKLTGKQGSITVENISGADIDGDIWIYYKYSSEDLFYGGITFRSKIAGGLKAGERAQVSAGHYQPEDSGIVWVDAVAQN